MQAYCIKCKAKREIQNPEPVFTSNARPGTRGTCSVCGTNLFRMGRTPAHEGMEPPPPPKKDGKLVIVESPAKARTVGRFLGKDYAVRASVGHVRDLLRSSMSVDVENDFEPRYRIPNEKRDVVKELRKEVKKSEEVYLATDPDREGEAIAWHLIEAARIKSSQARRVVFHEITREAIDEAFSHPAGINQDLVDAQQARRILDRLVGYSLSPLLWRKVRGRLSAGRVQSVAVRLVVEREREIEAFVPDEYWSIEAELAKREEREPRRSFIAKLHRIRGEKVDLGSEAATQEIVDELEEAIYTVDSVKKGTRRRNPSAPYTTSTMQQEASRRLRFTPRRTMRLAQQLYEGVDLEGEEPVGLITYMRTDSTHVSEQAQAQVRDYVAQRYGKKFLPKEPPVYKTKSKGAQEAHEAIRPTSVLRTPKSIKEHLNRNQYRLYRLIWQRFVASQMKRALYDTIRVNILAGPEEGEKPYLFRASGSKLRFPGFLIVYEEAKDEDEEEEEPSEEIPPLTADEILDLLRLIPEQHFTQPPPRYTQASLVRTLEEYGIGRPSTYASILSTIQQRGYVHREGRRLAPTETGIVVNDLLVEHFPQVLDYGFTAQLEDQLDEIATGERDWVPVVREFYTPFKKHLDAAEENIEKVDLGPREVGRDCPECGEPLIVRWGRYGKFIGCKGFPDCRYTEPWLDKVGVECPKCGSDMVRKRTRRGRTGYGCSGYPDCEFWLWRRPLPQPCPTCGGLLTEGRKGMARCTVCEMETPLDDLPEVEEMEEEEDTE